MSSNNIKQFWCFRRIKINKIEINCDHTMTIVELAPDNRYLPICSCCGQKVKSIHSIQKRYIRDLPMAQTITLLQLTYRKVKCQKCGIRIEYIGFVHPYSRVTNRFANYIFNLCQYMTVNDAANHVKLSWDQVKLIDKLELKKRHKEPNLKDVKFICMDEISIFKHHKYLTIIANYLTGQVIGVVKNRDFGSLYNFLNTLPVQVLSNIKAVAMDMWDPYIKVINTLCPKALIIFDRFHVISSFNKVIDKVRNQEYRNASKEEKNLMKHSRFLLLKNAANLNKNEKPRLKEILNQNQLLAKVYILKEYLKRLWQYIYQTWAKKFLQYWCELAYETCCIYLKNFANMLIKYQYGIINHCKFKINNAKLEGINNKIKVIKRKAYGYLDIEYFGFKIMQATSN